MTPDQFVITITGIAGIVFTYWFFLMKKDEVVEVTHEVSIIVDGGYTPSVVSIPKGKTTKIHFLRKDPNSCLEEVVLWDFKIKKSLPLNKTVTVEISPTKTGEYDFACGMNMYHGKLIVRNA